jgi:Matrixin
MVRNRGRGRRSLLGLFLAFGAVTAPAEAHAFCRTTTVTVPADYDPTEGCFTQGNVLWWRNACVGYSIQRDASRQVTLDEAEQSVATAFAKWTGTACREDDAGQSRVSIDVRDEGPVDCDEVQYSQNQPNQHVILFRDDVWPYTDSNNTLALTTVTFDPNTGELYDADMEINSASAVTLTVSGPVPPGGYDFESVVTHESGHFLGMAHSPDSRATMFARYIQGSTSMRNLSEDDVDGICAAYPPDGTRTTSVGSAVPEDACDPTPRHGFSTQCAARSGDGSCLITSGASAPGRGPGGGPGTREEAALAAVGVIACALGRKRARRARARFRSA